MDDYRADIRKKIEDWFEKHSDEMLDDLEKLIAVKSVRGPSEDGAPYGPGPREALKLAGSMLESRGFEVSGFEDIIISADYGPAPPKLGILAHLDVVDPGEGWETDPYGMAIKEGRIFGRGATDNKGPSVASMYAVYCVRDIYPQLRSGVRLILRSGEESGCEDVALYISKNETPECVFSPDADYPIVNTEKGRALVFFGASWDKEPGLPRVISITGGKTTNIVPSRAEAVIEGFTLAEAEVFCCEYGAKTDAIFTARPDGDRIILAAEGKSSHAALPNLGLNAQTALLEMLSAMPMSDSKGFGYIKALSRLFPHGGYNGSALGIAMSDDISGELTMNFGVLRFSEYELAGNIDCRTPACADEIDLLGIIRTAMENEGLNLVNSDTNRCHHTPGDSPFVKSLLRIYEEYTGEPGGCLAMGGQTYVHEIPGGVAFGCEMPGADNHIHGVNEFIEMEQLMISAKMFAHAIIDICG